MPHPQAMSATSTTANITTRSAVSVMPSTSPKNPQLVSIETSMDMNATV
jgi:hypothetical protein